MSRISRSIALACAVAAAIPAISHAQAGNYLLNSADPNNGSFVNLTAGTWSIGVSNGAWSPWNYVSNCDGAGANCQTGFHTVFYYTIDGGPVTKYGWDGSERTQFIPQRVNDFYATQELALGHAFDPFALTVTEPTVLKLFITDCCYWDNVGTLTVTVAEAQPETVVPEPASVVLMAAGLAGLGVVVRRRAGAK